MPRWLRLGMMASLAAFNAVGGSLHADMIQIGPAKDNTLYQDAFGTLSNGSGERVFAGLTLSGLIRRAVIGFDIAANIPPGSTINSVTLTMNMSRTISGAHTVELRALLADWGEAGSDAPLQEGGGAPAQRNDATWIHTFFDTSFWATTGGDFSNTVSASTTVAGLGFYNWGSTPQMVSDVQDWLDNPGTDFGWIVLGDEATSASAKRFDSRENPTAANRPLLTVDFSPPPSCPFNCGDIDGSGGNVNLVDFASFAVCFNGSPSSSTACACSDLDANGSINLQDFATLSLIFNGSSTNVPPNCP